MRRPALIAAALIAASMAVALMWALKMPILQCPDEDNHYDYALTVATAGRLISPSEGDTQPDTHPTLRHLLAASNAFSIRFDRLARVGPDYGSRRFFETVDRQAPAIDEGHFHRGPISPVPYISKLYPFAYYGALALVLRAENAVAPGSVVAQFYVARFFSIFLLGIALIFSWLLLAKMCRNDTSALLLLACTALFPLVTQVGACVQPDNLSFALVMAALYIALRCFESFSPANSLALVVCMTLLIATKRQYFLAVFLAVAFALLAKYINNAAERRRLAATAIALVAVPAAAYQFTAFFMHIPADAHALCSGSLVDVIARPAHSGPNALAFYAWQGFSTQFTSAFVGGQAMWMYWIAFGAYGNQMTIGSERLTDLLFHVITGVSVTALLLTLVRFANVGRRLGNVARRRSIPSALHVASRNIPVNAFLCFAVILFGYEVWVGGIVAIQGRYWLAFVPVIWYVLAFISPKALPKRYATAYRKIVMTGLLAFCILATASIPASIQLRYYSPAQPDPAAETLVLISGDHGRNNANLGTVSQGRTFVLSGTVLDLRTPGPARRVVFRIDHQPPRDAVAASSFDFACANTYLKLTNVNYKLEVPTRDLSPGRHTVRVSITTPWHTAELDTGKRASFDVTAK